MKRLSARRKSAHGPETVIKIRTPVIALSKSEIIKRGLDSMRARAHVVLLSGIGTRVRSLRFMCRRLRAFVWREFADPIAYSDNGLSLILTRFSRSLMTTM